MGDRAGAVVTTAAMRRALIAAVASFGLVLAPRAANAHPLHTTFVELSVAPKTSAITATVKVFADDFLKRVTRGTAVKPGDDAALQRLTQSYLQQVLVVNSAAGEAIPLRFCGWKRSADLIFICMTGIVKQGLAGLKVRDAILADVFDDQVNVLQADYGGSRHTLLFMHGSEVQRLH